jgi:hypothetical protein
MSVAELRRLGHGGASRRDCSGWHKERSSPTLGTRMRYFLGSLGAIALAFSFAVDAAAFCRTTTVAAPPGYDPTTNGCITQGVPLAWPSMPVTFELHDTGSTQISLDAATPIFDAAFAAWSGISCSTADPSAQPSLSFQRLGPTDAPFTDCDADTACQTMEADGPHQIIFRDDEWPYDDSANAIALTTVTFGIETGHIRSANIEINSRDFRLSAADPPSTGLISLSAIARHEAGHFIGLAHAPDPSAVMYAFYQPSVMALTQDDIDGVCAIYPPPSSSCSCSTLGRGNGGSAPGVAALAVVVTAVLRRRRSLLATVQTAGTS